MKTIKLLIVLLALTCVGTAHQPVAIASAKKAPPDPKKVEQKQEYSPQVKLFVARCLEDEEHKFSNVEAWLRLQKIAQPDRDQMWEVISGLVWNIDRERARKIALEIKNLEKQKAVLLHYDALDLLPPPPAKRK